THARECLTFRLDSALLGHSGLFPAPKVRRRPLGGPEGWLPFFGLMPALRTPIKYAAFKIDMPASDGRHQRSTANRRVAGAGVQPEQDEASHVPADRALSALIPHNLPRPPCRPDQPCRLRSRHPALTCNPLLGNYH